MLFRFFLRRLGSRCYFSESNKRGTLGGLFFSEKAWKERFSFREKQLRDGFNVTFRGVPQAPKSPQGRFYVTFSFVRKSNQKRHFYVLFASAKRTKKQPGLRPATSVQSATQACFFIEIVAFRV